MSDWLPPTSQLGLYLFATLLICLAPGPNVMLSISLGLRAGAGAALRGVAGVVVASSIFLTLSALGIAAALHASPRLFAAIRYAGAAYLVYVGIRLVVAGARATAEARAPVVAGTRAFVQGFVTQLSNPKSVLFWTAFLPQFLAPQAAVAPQIVALGAMGMAIDAVVLAGYGLTAAATRRAALSGAFQRYVDVVAGAFFVATGLWLAVSQAPLR